MRFLTSRIQIVILGTVCTLLILVFQNCGSFMGPALQPTVANSPSLVEPEQDEQPSEVGPLPTASPLSSEPASYLSIAKARVPQFVEKSAQQLLETTAVSVSFAAVDTSRYCSGGTANPVYGQLTFTDLDLKTPIDVSRVSIGKAIWTQLMLVNCTNETWGAGYRLGSADPQDNFLWGVNRVNLPPDIKSVPPGHQLTLRFIARAPLQAGTFAMSWALLKEGAKWFKSSSTANFSVKFPSQSEAPLCPGADPSIRSIAGEGYLEMQVLDCLKKTANGGVLEFSSGVHYLTRKIYIDRPITIRTVGTAAQPFNCLANEPIDCAIFVAHPAFNAGSDKTANAFNGLFVVNYASNVHLDHVVLHGNRLNRLTGPIADLMNADRSWGANATFTWCNTCTISYVASVNSLGSSGLQFIGNDAVIVGNVVRDGGQAPLDGGAFINDGFTILDGLRLVFVNNLAMNNTDIDMIFSHIKDGTVKNNVVLHETSSPSYKFTGAMGGMMLDNFNVTALSDSSGSVIEGNWINCNGACQIGLQLGPYPWYPGSDGAAWKSSNETRGCVAGGSITKNTVLNAKQGINIAGAKARVRSNIVSDGINVSRLSFITCSEHDRSRLNHEPTNLACQSDVGENFDLVGSGLAVTRFAWDNCY